MMRYDPYVLIDYFGTVIPKKVLEKPLDTFDMITTKSAEEIFNNNKARSALAELPMDIFNPKYKMNFPQKISKLLNIKKFMTLLLSKISLLFRK